MDVHFLREMHSRDLGVSRKRPSVEAGVCHGASLHTESSRAQLPQESIVDKRLSVDEDVQELLSTPLWKKR